MEVMMMEGKAAVALVALSLLYSWPASGDPTAPRLSFEAEISRPLYTIVAPTDGYVTSIAPIGATLVPSY